MAAIGITNQRDDRALGSRPGARGQRRRLADRAPVCERLKKEGLEPLFRGKTGLLLDAYFSGTKITHLFEKHPELKQGAQRGEILFGTVDTWLAWNLSGGKLHVTDPSNASRTLLFNVNTREWDDELLDILGVPRAMLPEVRTSSEIYGQTDPDAFGRPIPIARWPATSRRPPSAGLFRAW